MRIPDLTYPECSSFEEYEQDPDVTPLEISEKDLQWVTSKLLGEAGPSGKDAQAFQSWLLRFGIALESLREEMVEWIYWLANDSPPWAACHAIMTARLVALEKCPGVRPAEIGEVCLRLFSNIVLQVGGAQAKEACGSVNLCAGLEAGIEGDIHAVR